MTTSDKVGAWVVISVIALLVAFFSWMRRRRALGCYWDRTCTGLLWRRRFPDSSQEDLREFLTLFANAFGFSLRNRTCFSPDDRVMDVYRAVHPPGSLADDLELETLGLSLEQRYGVDFNAVWHEDMTLGELYERTRVPIG